MQASGKSGVGGGRRLRAGCACTASVGAVVKPGTRLSAAGHTRIHLILCFLTEWQDMYTFSVCWVTQLMFTFCYNVALLFSGGSVYVCVKEVYCKFKIIVLFILSANNSNCVDGCEK